MHVGPCGAAPGARIGPPTIAAACFCVTRLHGVNVLRALPFWPATRAWQPGAFALPGAWPSLVDGCFTAPSARGVPFEDCSGPPQAARSVAAETTAIRQSERTAILPV